MAKIEKVIAREIIDSRGFPTVEADVYIESGEFGRASVPSGTSTGKFEAYELRDNDPKRFLGKGVLKAVKNINTLISDHLKGQDSSDQENIDKLLIELDGTKNKENIGANAILAVSIANYKVAHVFEFKKCTMPVPLVNILNGGVHADNLLDIQEFMIVPVNAVDFKHATQISCEIFHNLKKILSDNSLSTNLGDEGGYAPQLKNHNEALGYLMKAIEKSGYKPGYDVYIALDAAASEFFYEHRYVLRGEKLNISSRELIEYYEKMISSYPIISIEDPLSEYDLDGWVKITETLGNKIQLVGDDLFVTNVKKLQEGIYNKMANSILIKLNQIGTVTETIKAIDLAKKNNYSTIISHRSGETEDSFIADLAVGSNAGQIKTGSMARSERLSKYNQLIRIEYTNEDCFYSGNKSFKFLK